MRRRVASPFFMVGNRKRDRSVPSGAAYQARDARASDGRGDRHRRRAGRFSQTWATMPEAEGNAIFKQYRSFTESIQQTGAFLAGAPLQPTTTATTVRLH